MHQIALAIWLAVTGKSQIVQLPVLGVACVITTALALLEPVLAAGLVALLVKACGMQSRSVLFWVTAAPVLYAIWLFILLGLYTLQTTVLSLWFEKPRRLDSSKDRVFSISAITLIVLYRRAFLVGSLPMILHFAQVPVYAWLIPRSYSTKLFLGDRAIPLGTITDPDLTVIGAGSILGHDSRLIAHSFTRSETGSLVYQSAPIELGRNVTVGGGAQIEMGAMIGDGSLIEPCAHVMPFTRIPAGEVWGGQPAAFRRKRESLKESATVPRDLNTTGSRTEEVTTLVADALSVPRANVSPSSTKSDFTEWDSIGMMAIAAAIHDRFGVTVPADKLFELESITAIEQFLTRKDSRVSLESKITLPDNVELLPMYDPAMITAGLARKVQWQEVNSGCRVVVAASFTAEPLSNALKLWARAFGIAVDVEFCGFNQVQQALLDPESSFHKNREGLNVVLLRPEDIAGQNDPDGTIAGGQLLLAVGHYLKVSKTPLLASDLPSAVSLMHEGKEVEQLRALWRRNLESKAGVEILEFSRIIAELGMEASRDAQMEAVASAPYSAAVYQRLGMGIARSVRKMRVPPKKVVALDCDGTLWGGVIGEDGMDGIDVESFRKFQSELLRLRARGILLVLVSKNSETDVWNVLEDHPRMLLRRKDVAAARINWGAKSKNLRDIATELNLGLDSFVFLDDNPVERLEVEANCPEVTVVPLPQNASSFAETVSRLWLFDSYQLTREDSLRSKYMAEEVERKNAQEQAGDLQAYLESLELKVEIRKAGEADFPRVAQLTQKTNQFNLSLKRRTEQEIRELAVHASIWLLSAKDRFGDYGVVGVGITRQQDAIMELDTFLLSCRALGRGMEQAFLNEIIRHGVAANNSTLVAAYVEGPRNQPIASFLRNNGFEEQENGIFSMPIRAAKSASVHIDVSFQEVD